MERAERVGADHAPGRLGHDAHARGGGLRLLARHPQPPLAVAQHRLGALALGHLGPERAHRAAERLGRAVEAHGEEAEVVARALGEPHVEVAALERAEGEPGAAQARRHRERAGRAEPA